MYTVHIYIYIYTLLYTTKSGTTSKNEGDKDLWWFVLLHLSVFLWVCDIMRLFDADLRIGMNWTRACESFLKLRHVAAVNHVDKGIAQRSLVEIEDIDTDLNNLVALWTSAQHKNKTLTISSLMHMTDIQTN